MKGAFTMTTATKTGITEITMSELEMINGGNWLEDAWDWLKDAAKGVFVDPFVQLWNDIPKLPIWPWNWNLN